MEKFAKLITFKTNEQVLLTIHYNSENDNYEVAIRTDLEGCSMQVVLKFKDEIEAINALKNYNLKHAKAFRKKMIALHNSNNY